MAEFPGVYFIKNAENGTYLTMTLSGTKTFVVCPHKAGDKKSLWRLLPQADPNKRYALKNVEYELEAQCDTRGGLLYGATSGHLWIVERLSLGGSEYHYIHVGYNNLVVDPGAEAPSETSNARVIVNRRSKLQLWVFETIRDPGQGTGPGNADGSQRSDPPLLTCYPVTPGIYVLKNVRTGTVIHLEPGTGAQEDKVFGHQANGSANQKWYIYPTDVGTNLWIYNSINTGFAGFPNFERGAILQSPTKTGGYMITPADKGFHISPVESPYNVLDLARGNGANGTVICLWYGHNGDNQKWYFEPA
ncbi:unnamed protein product [Rhizoctonia solani]|uniref:Ricin B lectin domain-containing protein n=1 Tax=Rhizoctonia solani TaxID=456999 RepID=A0A8H3HCS4_9AGAM|nr:unnamed protein product [Rhizoctonia solani]